MKNRLFNHDEAELLEEIIHSRRDVRGHHFLPNPLSEDVLNKILLAGINAPSVGYSQPWEFVLIKDSSTKEKVLNCFNEENQKAKSFFTDKKVEQYSKLKLEGIMDAPLNMAVFYKPAKTPVLGQTSMEEMGLYSVVCAIQNMWLMSRVLNVGMGWVSIINPDQIKAILNAPPENQLVAYLCMGYVTEFLPSPELELLNWDTRKQLNQVVYLESY